MKLLKRIGVIFDSFINFLAFLAGVLLVIIMISVVSEILLRYFGYPTNFVIEFTAFGLLFITFLGSAWVLRLEGHVKMDLVLTRLNSRIQTVVNIITSFLGTIICLVITWYGVLVTWHSFQKGYRLPTTLEPLAFPILSIIPVGSFFLSIQFVRRIKRYLKEPKC